MAIVSLQNQFDRRIDLRVLSLHDLYHLQVEVPASNIRCICSKRRQSVFKRTMLLIEPIPELANLSRVQAQPTPKILNFGKLVYARPLGGVG
jgi:hypothetical protein